MKYPILIFSLLFCGFLSNAALATVNESPKKETTAQKTAEKWFERQTSWKGFDQFHFSIAGRKAYLVTPKKAAAGNPWVWRARFPSYHSEADVKLLGKGFHIAYLDVAGMFGSPKAVSLGDKFYEFLTTKRSLAAKPALEGVSRGGLFIYNWAAKNPTRVACIYADTPVCDFKSWPAGWGQGIGHAATWKKCLKEYGLNEQQARSYKKNPIDNLATIAKHNIPILHIVSESDRIVPPKENTYILQSRLKKLGCKMEVISVAQGTKKSNGHHFTHPQIPRVVKFIAKHAT